MKNIVNEKPSEVLCGRLLYTTEFVDDVDLSDKKVLNIGCGYGWFELNSLSKNIGDIIGAEISENDLTTAKNNVINNRVSFVVSSAIDIKQDDKIFDTVTSWEVIEHIPKKTEKKMFEEVNRVLKDGGIFYLSTPNKNILSNLLDPAWYFGHRHYSLDKLAKIANHNGFEIEKYSIKGGVWEMLSVVNMYISKWILRRRPIFLNFFINKSKKEYNKNKNYSYDLLIKFKKIKNIQ